MPLWCCCSSGWSASVSAAAATVAAVAGPSRPPGCCSPADACSVSVSSTATRRGRLPPRAGWAPEAVGGSNDDDDDDVAAFGYGGSSMVLEPEAEFAGRSERPRRPTGEPPRCRGPPALRTLLWTDLRAMINPCRVSGRAARGPRCPPPRPWVPKRPRKQPTPRDPTWSPAGFPSLPSFSLIRCRRMRELLLEGLRCLRWPLGATVFDFR